EAGSRDHDAVMVFAVLLDVVGGIGTAGVIAAQGRFEKIVETVETDGLAKQRSQGQYVAHEYSPEISARVISRNPTSASRSHLSEVGRSFFKSRKIHSMRFAGAAPATGRCVRNPAHDEPRRTMRPLPGRSA